MHTGGSNTGKLREPFFSLFFFQLHGDLELNSETLTESTHTIARACASHRIALHSLAQVNEMGQMALQYGMTGYVKGLVVHGDLERDMTMSEELASAVAGGVLVSPFSSVAECVMIQQQRKVT